MANDKPTNLRMEFGYERARASGVTGFSTSLSVRRVNRDINENQATRQLNDELRKTRNGADLSHIGFMRD